VAKNFGSPFTNPGANPGDFGTKDFGSPFTVYKPPATSKHKKLTARQMAMLLLAMKKPTHRSFGSRLKGVGKGALGGATWAMTQLARSGWGVSSATQAALKEPGSILSPKGIEHVGEGYWKGISGQNRIGMGQVMAEHGVLDSHKNLRGVAGFGLDVVTDPIMLASLAADVPTGGGATAALIAARSAGKAVTPVMLKAAAREAGAAALKGTSTKLDGELLKEGGEKFAQRLALHEHNLAGIQGEVGEQATRAFMSERSILEVGAKAEAKINDPRKLQILFGTQKHGLRIPTGIPIITSPGAKLAQKNIPVLSQLSDHLGRAFVPSFGKGAAERMQLARKHVANQNGRYLRDTLLGITKGMDTGLSQDDMLTALHYFEQPLKTARGGTWKAVVPSKAVEGLYDVNPKYVELLVKKGLITDSQASFIHTWSDATNFLIHEDKMTGVQVEHLGQGGRLYVPHVIKKDSLGQIPSVAQHGLLTDAGFQGSRKGAQLSVKQIKELVDAGKLPKDIETDPMVLLWRRARAGSERQADMALINSIKSAVGVPTRIVDVKKVARVEARLEAGIAKREGAIRAAAHAEADYEEAVAKALADLEKGHNEGQKLLRESIKKARIAGRADQTTKLLAETKLLAARIKRLGKAPSSKIAKGTVRVRELKQVTWAEKEGFGKGPGRKFELKLGKQTRGTLVIVGTKNGGWRVDTVNTALGHQFQGVATRLYDEALKAHPNLKHSPVDMRTEDGKAWVAAMNKRTNYKKLTAELEQHQKALDILSRRRVVTPAIVKHQAEQASLTAKYQKAVEDIVNPKSDMHKAGLADNITALSVAKATKAEATKEIAAAKKALKVARRGKLNKFAKDTMVESRKVVDEYGNKYRFPQEAANVLERLERLASGEEQTVEEFTKGVGKWMGAWKILVTVFNPGYRVRNTMTDFWNMWLAGVPTHAIGTYGIKTGRMMAQASRASKGLAMSQKDMDAFWRITEAGNHGILAGLFAGDVGNIAQMLKYQDVKVADLFKHAKFFAGYKKMMTDMNKSAENWGRLTHLNYRMDHLGEDMATAAEKVKLAHFDYEDLTPFEQKVMKKVFPFYTWTRKNIPYQVRQILAEPGRYSAFPKMVQEAQFAAGNPNDIVPDYVEEGFGFPIGGHNYYMPQFGVSDLQALQGPGQAFDRVKGMLGPQFKIPIEAALNKSLFTGQEIAPEGHTRVPISARGQFLLGLLPGTNPGATSRSTGSGTQTTPGINPWASYIAGQIPMARTALGIGAGTPAKRNQQLLSYFGGQSVQHIDPAQQAYYASIGIQEDTDRFLDELRGEGRYPRSKRKKSDFDKLLESILGGNYGSG
jgi:hypothetical protein